MRALVLGLALLASAGCKNTLAVFPTSAPDRVSVVTTGPVAADVRWDSVPGATGYTLYVGVDPDVGPGNFDRRYETALLGEPPLPPGYGVEGWQPIDLTEGPALDGLNYVVVVPNHGNTVGVASAVVTARTMGSPVSNAAVWAFTPTDPNGACGSALAGADTNTDGYEDLFVGCPGANAGKGDVFLFLGTPFGLSTAVTWSFTGTLPTPDGARAGSSLEFASDFRGLRTLLVGLPGAARVDAVEIAALTLSTSLAFPAASGFGATLGDIGDVNNDGIRDVAVGAPAQSGTSGCIVLYSGDANVSQPCLVCDDAFPGSGFGRAVAAAGNLDGDAFDDVAVGAPDGASGAVVALKGNGTIFGGSCAPIRSGRAIGAPGYGSALAPAGDPNENDRDSFFVGDPFAAYDIHEEAGFVRSLSIPGAFTDVPASADASYNDGPFDHFGAALETIDFETGTIDKHVLVGLPGRGAFDIAEVTGEEGGPEPVLGRSGRLWTAPGYDGIGERLLAVDANGDGRPDVAAAGGNAVVLFLASPAQGPNVSAGLPLDGAAGGTVELVQASFADPLLAEHTCVVDWGDGAAAETFPCAPGALTDVAHAYATAGDYVVRLSVTSKDGRAGEAVSTARIAP